MSISPSTSECCLIAKRQAPSSPRSSPLTPLAGSLTHSNTLVINGSTLHLKESSDETTHVQTERHYSPFSRSIRLPHGLQDNEITASMEHGLLKLELPKQPKEGHGVKIEIA